MLLKFTPICLFTVLLLILIPVTSSFADDNSGLYFGIQAGAVFPQDTDAGQVRNLEFDNGAGGAVALGYDLGKRYARSRVELELSYRNNDVDGGELGVARVNDGEVAVTGLLANFFYAFDTEMVCAPYLMAGLGAAHVDIKDVTIDGTTFIDNDEVAFAYQGGAGLDFHLTDNLALDLSYRYFGTADKEFENNAINSSDKRFDFHYKSHNAFVGLRYRF